jgi:type II secretory pathway component PulF
MNYYKYKLIAPSGEVCSGNAKLPYQDLMSAIYHLERDGSTALYVKKLGILRSFVAGLADFRLLRRLSGSVQAEFLSNISLMLRSGVTLTAALKEASESLDRVELSGDIDNMIISIQGGAAFSDTAEKYRHIFPRAVIHLIRIGEETGRLDAMLKNGSDHLKKVQAIISDTKQALIYPALVLTTMAAGFIFWVYYVAPKILALFKDMDITLPTLTIIVMKVSYFCRDYILYILMGLALVIFSLLSAYKINQRLRKVFDAVLLKLPVVGKIVSASTLAFITEYFALLLNAGVDLLQAMTILKTSIKNEIYQDKLAEISEDLKKGESISTAFEGGKIFPTYVTRMISVGEMSGTLTEQLNYVADEYRNRLSTLVATIGKMIEPVILIIAGVLFAVIFGGLLLPIYDLASHISQ